MDGVVAWAVRRVGGRAEWQRLVGCQISICMPSAVGVKRCTIVDVVVATVVRVQIALGDAIEYSQALCCTLLVHMYLGLINKSTTNT